MPVIWTIPTGSQKMAIKLKTKRRKILLMGKKFVHMICHSGMEQLALGAKTVRFSIWIHRFAKTVQKEKQSIKLLMFVKSQMSLLPAQIHPTRYLMVCPRMK